MRECLDHDPEGEGGFLDESRFQRLVPALVAQLGAQATHLPAPPAAPDSGPPTDVSTAPSTAGDASHQLAEGVKGTLVALALKGGSDVRWKGLHRQVSASLCGLPCCLQDVSVGVQLNTSHSCMLNVGLHAELAALAFQKGN